MTHHLVILQKTYFTRILRGTKTTECRLSKTKRAPYQRVRRGDTLWLKQSGGNIKGKVRVHSVTYFQLEKPLTLNSLRKQYSDTIQANQDFFERHKNARFVTLIHLSQIRVITPIRVKKSDQHAWVVLSESPK